MLKYWKLQTKISLVICFFLFLDCSQNYSPELESAMKAANWLENVAIDTENGMVWPTDPNDSTSVITNFYSGSSGVVLFFLEMYHLTNQIKYLEIAQSGADYLLSTLPDSTKPEQLGLYTGLAGIGFVLEETYKTSVMEKYREGFNHCLKLINRLALEKDDGVDWNNVTDIISGSAGIGLFLLYAEEELKTGDNLNLAVKAGNHLIQKAIPENGGLKWPMSSDYPRLMPNFSHGTAGVCLLLAKLYEKTNDKIFLEKALLGVKYLQSITDENGLIFHHEPGGEDLCYLGWCHGPPGTAQLYFKLWQITKEKKWLAIIEKTAQTLLNSGIPENQTPGFWNNVGQCCGSAGIGELFLQLYKVTKNQTYLDFARKLTDDILSKSTEENNGLKWIQAEHRSRPDLLVAQTGYMQGAAGTGMWFLHLDAIEIEKKPKIKLPDSVGFKY